MFKFKKKKNKNIIENKYYNDNFSNNPKEYFQFLKNTIMSHFYEPNDAMLNEIKIIKNNNLDSGIRFFLYFIFLNIFPYDTPEKWKNILDNKRKQYSNIKKCIINKNIEMYIKNNDIDFIIKQNPNFISKEDKEIIDLIKKDVSRTFQDYELFKDKNNMEILINILFIYAKENKIPGYKQGMNEICGILLYILYKNIHVDINLLIEDSVYNFPENYILIYDLFCLNEFFENDLYTLFINLMAKDLSLFYSFSHETYKKGSLSNLIPIEKYKLNLEQIENSNESDIKKRIYKNYYVDLKKIDKEIYSIIAKCIEPDIFMTKWYLCFFSREFDLENVVKIFDVILLYEWLQFTKNKLNLYSHLNYIDFISLSMILSLKKIIIKNKKDETNLLLNLMHYPNTINFKHILDNSFKICYMLTKSDLFNNFSGDDF